jgi:hypothetical protein
MHSYRCQSSRKPFKCIKRWTPRKHLNKTQNIFFPHHQTTAAGRGLKKLWQQSTKTNQKRYLYCNAINHINCAILSGQKSGYRPHNLEQKEGFQYLRPGHKAMYLSHPFGGLLFLTSKMTTCAHMHMHTQFLVTLFVMSAYMQVYSTQMNMETLTLDHKEKIMKIVKWKDKGIRKP